VIVIERACFGHSGPADEERSSGAGEVSVGFCEGESGAIVGEKHHEGVVGEAGFFEGFENATDGVIETTNGVVVVRKFLADFREIGEVGGDDDFVRRVELGRSAPGFLGGLWVVEGPVGIVRVDHEVEGFVFLLAAGEELCGEVVILLGTTAGIEFFVVVGEVPLEVRVGGGVVDLAQDTGEVAVLLEGAEDSGDVFR